MDSPSPTLSMKPDRLAASLVSIAFILIGLSLAGQSFRFFTLPFEIHSPAQEFLLDMFIDKFSVNTEANVPTYFNALLLVLAAALAYAISSIKRDQRDRYRYEWTLLALVFMLLSIDEASGIHETFNRLFKDAPEFGGWLHYKWLIPGGIVLAGLSLAFLRFFLHLSPGFKRLFLLSGALYIAGAFGGELLSGRHANTFGTKNFTYAAMTTAEEFLEWAGAVLMIFALARYLEVYFPQVRFFSGPGGKNDDKDGAKESDRPAGPRSRRSGRTTAA